MNTAEVNLLVFDTKTHFNKTKSKFGEIGVAFKSVVCITSESDFQRKFTTISDDEYVFLVVHVFGSGEVEGLTDFEPTLIWEKYPKLGCAFVSEYDQEKIRSKMAIQGIMKDNPILKYHQLRTNLTKDYLKVYRKSEILNDYESRSRSDCPQTNHIINGKNEKTQSRDYAIITALRETEMEAFLPNLTIEGRFRTKRHLFEFGHLKSNEQKTIVCASQLETGMVDAAILATELIMRFDPKFLIMAGVLGGKPDKVNIGDVVVAKRVFTIDKGKISGGRFEIEIESEDVNSSYVQSIMDEKDNIINYIKQSDEITKKTINIHFDPISTVRQVINVKGFFEANITTIDRKTIALEMEGYGIARACALINDRKTTPIIIKAAMDNTKDKVDDAKAAAARVSAKVVNYLLEKDII